MDLQEEDDRPSEATIAMADDIDGEPIDTPEAELPKPQSSAETAASAAPVIWVETKTDSGKSYFYHSVTRETTWTRPEGPNVKVLTQAELELANKQVPAAAVPQGRPPPVLFGGPPPRFAMPPPLVMPPPGFGAPTWMIPPVAAAQAQAPPPPNASMMVDPVLLAKANEWTEHKAPDGRTFYYNASKGESVWEKPEALVQLEASRLAALHSQQMPKTIPLMQHPPIHTHLHHQPPIMAPQLGPPPAVLPPGAAWMQQVLVAAEVQKRQMEERSKLEQEERNKAAAAVRMPVDKSKPVSSTPISGTPWCVVWTGDGRCFFYNPSTKTSVWECPEELTNRPDVVKAMSTVPEVLLANNPGNVVPTTRTLASAMQEKQAPAGEGGAESESDSGGDDEEGFPSKKFKGDAGAPDDNKQPGGITTAQGTAEAEQQAAKERASIPLEQRINSFKEMLREKDVSAFSTWEKELHKIVFDQRYLLLTSRERKQIFEKYVKDRAEEERKEKRTKIKQRVNDFRALMESAGLHGKSSFSEFAQKYAKDERLRGIEKMRERESLFNEFIIEVRKREKEEAANKKEQIKKDFIQMLRDHPHVDRHCRWSEVRKMVDGKSAYKAVESGELREELFNEYCRLMKEERKNKDKRDRKDKDGDKDRGERKRKNSDDKGDSRRDSIGDHEDELDNDPDQEAENAENLEEQLRKQKELERQLRAEASLREREKEVQRTLAGHLRERDSKREHHKKGEAIGQFNALLTDLVRNSDLTWKDVKRLLRKDHRYPMIESALEREERERLFNEHIHTLEKKKRDKFREMLDELPNLDFNSSWREVKRLIRDDPRYMKYNSSDKCEREFYEYLKDKTTESKAAFRELLQECKLINHKSLEVLRENPSHMHEIEEILRIDKRFLDLDHVAEERSQMIYTHLEELHKRGPPPPPTAATATRRKPM